MSETEPQRGNKEAEKPKLDESKLLAAVASHVSRLGPLVEVIKGHEDQVKAVLMGTNYTDSGLHLMQLTTEDKVLHMVIARNREAVEFKIPISITKK